MPCLDIGKVSASSPRHGVSVGWPQQTDMAAYCIGITTRRHAAGHARRGHQSLSDSMVLSRYVRT